MLTAIKLLYMTVTQLNIVLIEVQEILAGTYLVGATMTNLGDELTKLGDEVNDLVIADSGST